MLYLGKFVKNAIAVMTAFLLLFAVMYFALYQSDKEDMTKTEWVKKEYVK